MPNGDRMLSNPMLLGETMILRGQELVINLIVLDMLDFNMILGINFLTKYEAKINCRMKKFGSV